MRRTSPVIKYKRYARRLRKSVAVIMRFARHARERNGREYTAGFHGCAATNYTRNLLSDAHLALLNLSLSLSLSFFLSVFASCPRGNRVSSSIVFACDRQSDYTRLRIACISKLASCSNKSRDGIPIFIECKEKIGGVEGMKKEKKKEKKFSLVGSWFISKGAEVYTGEWRRLICEQVLLSAR